MCLKQRKNNVCCTTKNLNDMQIPAVISESIYSPRTLNFAVGTFLCNFSDFKQFTVDSSENNTQNN